MFLKCQSVTQLYIYMINASEPIHSFTIKDDDEDPSPIWTIVKHPRKYIGTIDMTFTVCIGVYCFQRFWIRPSTPGHKSNSQVSSQHGIVDDNVEIAPFYRHRGKVENP